MQDFKRESECPINPEAKSASKIWFPANSLEILSALQNWLLLSLPFSCNYSHPPYDSPVVHTRWVYLAPHLAESRAEPFRASAGVPLESIPRKAEESNRDITIFRQCSQTLLFPLLSLFTPNSKFSEFFEFYTFFRSSRFLCFLSLF